MSLLKFGRCTTGLSYASHVGRALLWMNGPCFEEFIIGIMLQQNLLSFPSVFSHSNPFGVHIWLYSFFCFLYTEPYALKCKDQKKSSVRKHFENYRVLSTCKALPLLLLQERKTDYDSILFFRGTVSLWGYQQSCRSSFLEIPRPDPAMFLSVIWPVAVNNLSP